VLEWCAVAGYFAHASARLSAQLSLDGFFSGSPFYSPDLATPTPSARAVGLPPRAVHFGPPLDGAASEKWGHTIHAVSDDGPEGRPTGAELRRGMVLLAPPPGVEEAFRRINHGRRSDVMVISVSRVRVNPFAAAQLLTAALVV